jgi:uncharacterized protein involved in exopolysaccharide biosynthesis
MLLSNDKNYNYQNPLETPQIQQHTDSEITIDIGKIFGVIASRKWTILIVTIIATLLGVFIAINTPNEYVSQVQILPELESKDAAGGLSKFKSLAGLAGVDLSSLSSSEAVRPDLYPNILQSTPFLMDVMAMKIYAYKYKQTLAMSRFLAENNKQELATKIFGESNDDDDMPNINPKTVPSETIRLDKKQDKLIKDLQKRIGATLDKKSGVISISVKMQDPVVAATIVKYSQDYLTQYVVKYRTEKTKNDIIFLNDRLSEAKRRYDNALYAYSSYQDRNKSLFLNIAKDEGKKMQYEVDLSYNLYAELAKQLEEAKIKVHRETPIFKVLEPAQIPVKKSEPKRSLMVIGFAFLGLMLSVIWVLARNYKALGLMG